VDAGDATVSDLQIFYLQKDPASWLTKSSAVLDQANSDVSAPSRNPRKRPDASTIGFILVILGTIFAIVFGFGPPSALRAPSRSLYTLITVAQEIGDSGDLDQNIDIHRNDEIGALATTFNNMVAYLKEMASVSMSVAEGDLTVEVVPRSKRDTLAMLPPDVPRLAGNRSHHPRRRLAGSAGSNQVAGAADESAKVSVQASSAIEESPAPCTR